MAGVSGAPVAVATGPSMASPQVNMCTHAASGRHACPNSSKLEFMLQ